MSDRHKVENEVKGELEVAHERIKDMSPEDGLAHRLSEIEAALGALAVYLDKAFAQIRGEESDEDEPPRRQSRDW